MGRQVHRKKFVPEQKSCGLQFTEPPTLGEATLIGVLKEVRSYSDIKNTTHIYTVPSKYCSHQNTLKRREEHVKICTMTRVTGHRSFTKVKS